MPVTYEPIATTTLGSAASDITFTSIGSAYTDLRLTLNASSSLNGFPRMQINGDTATNYSRTTLFGDGTAVTSGRTGNAAFLALSGDNVTSIPTLFLIDFFSYAGSTNKTMLLENARDLNGSGTTTRQVFLWRSTAAITSIKLYLSTNTFDAGTTATLYGILKA